MISERARGVLLLVCRFFALALVLAGFFVVIAGFFIHSSPVIVSCRDLRTNILVPCPVGMGGVPSLPNDTGIFYNSTSTNWSVKG